MPNVSDHDSRSRRQHQLADGRRSRGYTPIEDELLDIPIGGDAFKLLVHLRHDAIQRESDGFVAEQALAATAGFLGLKAARLRALLQELETAGLVQPGPRGVTDVNHATWCRSRVEREELRLQWAQRQRRARGTGEAVVPLLRSREDSPRESRRDTSRESPGVSRHSRSKVKEST